MTMLGSGFRPRMIDEPPAQVVPTDTERILAALADLSFALRQAQAPPPPPQIVIPEPDLGAIVTAVNGLKPGADADDVARAVVAQLAPPAPAGDTSAMAGTLERVADTLKALDFRMQAPTAMIGGGILHMDPAQLDASGNVKVAPANQTGTWGYVASTLTSGSLTGVGKCIGLRVYANGADGSFNIGGGNTITVRSGTGVDIAPLGTLTAPVVNWVSGTLDVVIEGLQ